MIGITNAHPRKRFPGAPIRLLVAKVLRGEGKRAGDISVVFTDHRRMRRLNWQYLHHRSTTDTIAFPLGETDRVEGEVFINLDQAARQANEYHVTAAAEIRRLVIHAVLHLCGYDDVTARKKAMMTKLEDRYLGLR